MYIIQAIGIFIMSISFFAIAISIASKSKNVLIFSLLLFVSGLLITMGSSTAKDVPTENPKLIVLGSLIIPVYVGYLFIQNKLRNNNKENNINNNSNVSKNYIPKVTSSNVIPVAKRYCDMKDELLVKYKENENYPILKDALDKLPTAYNQYAIELLGVTKLSKKTMDPIVATALGNSIAGVPGGVMMGLSAYEKKVKWEQELKDFDMEYRNIHNKENRVIYLVNTIQQIINN